MTAPFFTEPDLSSRLAQARDGLLEVLTELDTDAARWVADTARNAAGKPSVVVVGETKRGKSSLVNALLAEPDLSPVDAEPATATYLRFDHAESWQARACYPGSHPEVPIELDELVSWTSAAHELPAGQLPPEYVEVAGPCPLLERLTLVDTPGVGGLNSMHGERAMRAASAATALLYVVDASAPFTSTELDFLTRMADNVETVLFVLSKTDSFRGWRQVLEDNRELLRRHAPRFAGAEFHAVSALMFARAASAPNEKAARVLREQSGIAGLQEAVQRLVVGRADVLAEANALRAALTALDEQESVLEGTHRSLSSGEDEAQSLRERRDELGAQRRSSTKGWQVTLRSEIQRARLECSHEVSRQTRDVQSWFRQQVDASDRDALAALPQEVDAALQVLSGKLSELLGRRLNEVTETVLADLFAQDELRVVRSQFAKGTQPQVVVRPPDKRPPTAEDKLLVFMGVSGGFGAGKIAAAPLAGMALFNPVVLPATIAVGLGAGWWMARTRRHAADKQHMKQWLTESIAEARAMLDQLVSEQIIDAEQQLSLALDDALGKRIEAIDAELVEVDKALKLSAQERSRRLGEVSRQLKAVTDGQQRARKLLGSVS
ncbi:dynamin family protein [Haloechinothrix sp. YIM 98757]|uniref:Dynamin family protein n=1 Tax=Haloechinothrix aidingensis TaxID=2752311 RepID=A0A837ZTR8_9PSEU|nr:dynamin family protein [Haloechinothrix aidingensis]